MDFAYLATCQYEMPAQPHPVDCGEPAMARVWWDDGSQLFVCQEHLDFILNNEPLYPALRPCLSGAKRHRIRKYAS